MARRHGGDRLRPKGALPSISLLFAGMLAWIVPRGAVAWFDAGHLLIAEVARSQMNPAAVASVNAVLAPWEADFPGMSDLVGSAVWMDYIKCASHHELCRGGQNRAEFAAFTNWHYTDLAYDPEGVRTSGAADTSDGSLPSSVWALAEATNTLRRSSSAWSRNVMMRVLVHLVGDVHQPLHVTQGFFHNGRFGDLSAGDRGGNSIHIHSNQWPKLSNLHMFWDSGAGLFADGTKFSAAQRDDLVRGATALMAEFPGQGALLESASADAACFTKVDAAIECRGVFQRWAHEARSVAAEVAYGPGVASDGEPSAEYVARSQLACRRQITLAGYRLAAALEAIAPLLSQFAPRPRSGADTDSAFAAVLGSSDARAADFLTTVCAVQIASLAACAAALRQRRTGRTQKSSAAFLRIDGATSRMVLP